MATRRLARLNEQIRADLAELIARQMKDPRLSGLISVTGAKVTPDLRHVEVYVSVLGSPEDRKHTLQALRSASGFLRSQLAERMTTRRAPELHFSLDESIERGQRIMSLMHEIEKEEGDRPKDADDSAAEPAPEAEHGEG